MDLNDLKWSAQGLLPVVIADARSGQVLTLAYANREALERTIAERSTYLYSRSREALWHKGEQSGNTQEVVSVACDCDGDALVYRVIPRGPACHTGAESCFYNELLAGRAEKSHDDARGFAAAVRDLERVLEQRRTADPSSSRVARLYAGGVDKIGKKIGEEATEVVIAAKNASYDELVWESADLVFHLLVLLRHAGVSIDDVGNELLRRAE
jgi:phosphoribosyl-AMP cyclohydrolase / phosphoribosyl-ATP pyrophosphohydrolase